MWQCIAYIFLFLFYFEPVLWIPENALKSRVLYLEMLSSSFSVSSSPRYSCKICELQRLRVTEQTRYTLHWCQEAQVNDCSVTFSMLKSVNHFIFVLNLMWTYFSMLSSSRHFKCIHLWKCILYWLDLWIEVALQQKDTGLCLLSFLLFSPFSLSLLLICVMGYFQM